ncbi:MAG: O-antigen ligase family protein [bacterium]
MQSISNLNKIEKINYCYLFIIGLLAISISTVALLGIKGLILAILAVSVLIITPFLYNKPKIFLFFSLFVYPLTRFFQMEDKFVITGVLYTLSVPCAFWLINKYFRQVSTKSFYLWAIAMYIAVVLLNFFRPDIIDLVKEFGRSFFAIFTVLSVYDYVKSKPENLQKLSKYLSYILNIIALIAITQYFTGIGGMMNQGFYRVRGTFFNFNDYGFVLSLFICFALYILLNSQNFKQRFYWAATIGLNIAALIGTFSKTAIINTALIFFVMSIFLPWKRRLQLFGSFLTIGTVLFIFLSKTGALNTLFMRFGNTSSLQWRFEMWRILYDSILQGNIWIGQGANASRNFLQFVVNAGESFAPHNVYLETTYNFGLLGLIPFILIFILILFQGISIFFSQETINNQSKMIGISIITITLITMVQNFVSNAFYDRSGNIFFWVILTLLICWNDYHKSKNAHVIARSET